MENYKGHKAGIKHRSRATLIELTADREAQIGAEAEEVGLARGKKRSFGGPPEYSNVVGRKKLRVQPHSLEVIKWRLSET